MNAYIRNTYKWQTHHHDRKLRTSKIFADSSTLKWVPQRKFRLLNTKYDHLKNTVLYRQLLMYWGNGYIAWAMLELTHHAASGVLFSHQPLLQQPMRTPQGVQSVIHPRVRRVLGILYTHIQPYEMCLKVV